MSAVTSVVFRPQRLLVSTLVFSAVVVLASAGIWIGLGTDVQALFTGLQIATLLVFAAFMIGLMMSMGLSVAQADDRGLTWRNGVRRHRIDWSQVHGVRFESGDPWLYLYSGAREDPLRQAVMAIQSTDGALARAKSERLRAIWRRNRAR